VASVFDIIPTEDELDRRLCIAERERTLFMKLIRLAREADKMRPCDRSDRDALSQDYGDENPGGRDGAGSSANHADFDV
jgi:hypothetical protein